MPIYNHNLPIKANVIQGEGGTDTSQDTVTPETLLEGVTAHNAAGEQITGTCDYNANTENDTVTAEKMVQGITAHDASGQPITGTLDTEAIRAEGVEAGKKSEYDAFWDSTQLYGKRIRYEHFLSGVGIPTEIFKKPKHPIVATGGMKWCFVNFNNQFGTDAGGDKNLYTRPLDLSSWEIDASGVTDATGLFHNASVENLYLDLSNAKTLIQAFQSSNRGCANRIHIKVSEKCTTFQAAFWHNSYSQYSTDVVRFAEGSVIAAGDLNLSHCNLSKESLASVINALSSATTGKAVTLKLSAIKKAFETSEGANNGAESTEWQNLVMSKPNWTINAIDS